jgi:hypothetical protein
MGESDECIDCFIERVSKEGATDAAILDTLFTKMRDSLRDIALRTESAVEEAVGLADWNIFVKKSIECQSALLKTSENFRETIALKQSTIDTMEATMTLNQRTIDAMARTIADLQTTLRIEKNDRARETEYFNNFKSITEQSKQYVRQRSVYLLDAVQDGTEIIENAVIVMAWIQCHHRPLTVRAPDGAKVKYSFQDAPNRMDQRWWCHTETEGTLAVDADLVRHRLVGCQLFENDDFISP